MPMNYLHLDSDARDAREKKHVAATGHGDTGLLDDQSALAAEQSVCVLKLRRAFADEHATSSDPNPDPQATRYAAQRDELDGIITEAEAARDRIVAVTSTDVSGVMQGVLDINRAKAEQDFYDAEWAMNNIPGQPQETLDSLQVTCDRAEREAAVIDGWT